MTKLDILSNKFMFVCTRCVNALGVGGANLDEAQFEVK